MATRMLNLSATESDHAARINRSAKNLRRLMKESADGGGANTVARSGNPV